MNTKNIDLLPKFESTFSQRNWDKLSTLVNPKLFKTESEDLIAFPILAKVAQILTTDDPVVPSSIKIACLKCLGNSCFNGYIHKEYTPTDIQHGICGEKLYSMLATSNENLRELCNSYPFDSHFPYEGVVEWTSSFIKSRDINTDLVDEPLDILRLSIQFLCNLFTCARDGSSFPDQYNIPTYLNDINLKGMIIDLTKSEHVLLVRASCAFVHNALKEFDGKTFTELEKIRLCSQLLKPIKDGFQSAQVALIFLLRQPCILQNAYNDMDINDKLYLLKIIYNEICEEAYESKAKHTFPKDTTEFLSQRFCRRSDLILKTVDTYLCEMEPAEIIILLDILATLTSESSKEYNFLKDHKSLLINCTYLLKSIQMIGKASNNYFTPMQKLSDIAPAGQQLTANSNVAEGSQNGNEGNSPRNDPQNHPAFGFKAGLIRIIGNMSYKDKKCQDLLREMDAIPLLLDCCNIDARNPLIMQWTILALRNLCEDNPENQEVVRNCSRIGVVESSALQEMGLALHEDEEGRKIGIVPLVRDGK